MERTTRGPSFSLLKHFMPASGIKQTSQLNSFRAASRSCPQFLQSSFAQAAASPGPLQSLPPQCKRELSPIVPSHTAIVAAKPMKIRNRVRKSDMGALPERVAYAEQCSHFLDRHQERRGATFG